MQGILSAVFDNRRAADAAIEDLLAGGFSRAAIHLGTGDPTGGDSPLTGNGGSLASQPGASGVGNFLNTLFGTDNSEHVQTIAGAVTHSHLVLTLTASDLREAERAAAIVRGHAPVRIDTAAAVIPATGAPTQLQAEPPGRSAALEAARAAHEPGWRRHFAETRADSRVETHADAASPFPGDEHYDEYAPAYLYGLDMATHEQHGGKEWQEWKDWDEAEASLRGEWERRHPQSAWARFREAVRHSWERLRAEGGKGGKGGQGGDG